MIKLKTEVLKNMLNKAVKVCSFNNMLPITSLVEIETNERGLSVKTTDNITTMIITEKIEGLTPSRVVVDANIITALVNKITTEEIELIISDKALTITGNGVYNLEIRVDESGEIVKLPAIDQELINSANKEFDFKGITDKLRICRPAIPETEDQKEYNNYYMKDTVIATNVYKISSVKNVESMASEELFIPAEFGKILIELDYIKANYIKKDKTLVIVGENFVICTTMYGEFDKFPLADIQNAISQEYKYSVVVKKKDLAGLVDRLNLFVTAYDADSVDFIFTPDKLKVTNKKKTCDENIEYVSKNVTDLVELPCLINIEYFKAQLDVLPSEEITFRFGGSDTGMAMVDGDITQVVALLDGE